MAYDTFSSQRIENLPYDKKNSLISKLNCFKLISFEAIHSYTMLNIKTKHLYCKLDFGGGYKSLNTLFSKVWKVHLAPSAAKRAIFYLEI